MKHIAQLDKMDCGPACLKMVARHYGKDLAGKDVRKMCYINKHGVSILGIAEAAEKLGFNTIAAKMSLKGDEHSTAISEVNLPAILHWENNHFVVLKKISSRSANIYDPAVGKRKMNLQQLQEGWLRSDGKGSAIIIEPSERFYIEPGEKNGSFSFNGIFHYLKIYRNLVLQFAVGMLLLVLFQVLAPFLTQSIVDIGIGNQNIGFIYLILIAQLFLFVGSTSVSFIQSWILLHVGTRLNVSLVASFLYLLMKKPLSYFESRQSGDILQRISDHSRIETFITQHLLGAIMGVISLLVFTCVLFFYESTICAIFLGCSGLYISWVLLFLNKRKIVDHKLFAQMSANQDTILEIVNGIHDIKIHGSEFKRRQNWVAVQTRLFRANIEALKITQYQDVGAYSINQFKDIIIVVTAAMSVINGSISLGMMIAIQYIIGQMNVPLQNLVSFIRSHQDASISIKRLGEIYSQSDRYEDESIKLRPTNLQQNITFSEVSFRYTPIDDEVLTDITCVIETGKVTAIVGASGSGKSTFIKLVLGLLQPSEGKILVGRVNLGNIDGDYWRHDCGVVSENNYLFADTLISNITEKDAQPDYDRLEMAIEAACLDNYIYDLPLGYNTEIGQNGGGLSQGQRQRVLLARAIYSNPRLLILDEATNYLDAATEHQITTNIAAFTHNRTYLVVAHRLSTVRRADKIIVLSDGKIAETGTHDDLLASGSIYKTLVAKQLS